MITCAACDRDWPSDKCHTIQLTDEERKFLRDSGVPEVESYSYCNPCWRVLSDRLMGAQYIKGTLQIQLRSQGRANAEELSQQYFDRLLAITSKPKS